jgi:MbtH protein
LIARYHIYNRGANKFKGSGKTAMPNPFEESSAFHVVVNDEGQYSLWPAHIEVPRGWIKKFGPSAKADCLAFVETNWTDMRPRRLVREMESHTRSQT